PEEVGRPRGDAEDRGGFIPGKPRKEPELDQLGGLRVVPGELVERLVHGQDVRRLTGRLCDDLVQVDPDLPPAALQAVFAAGAPRGSKNRPSGRPGSPEAFHLAVLGESYSSPLPRLCGGEGRRG